MSSAASIMFVQPPNQCYVLYRPINQTMFSVHHVEGAKPKVVAFKDKAMASRFSRLVVSFEKEAQEKKNASRIRPLDPIQRIVDTLRTNGLTDTQRLELCPQNVQSLAKRCKMGGLELMLVNEDGSHLMCESKFDTYEYRFHLEEVFYYN